jgi:nucleoid-associated protein YgaU
MCEGQEIAWRVLEWTPRPTFRPASRRSTEQHDYQEGLATKYGNNQAAGFIRTNISPGRTTGSFMPVPQPIRRAGSTAILQEGETLRQLSKRAYGYEKWWPRIVALNNTYDFANREIPAGTVLRIG